MIVVQTDKGIVNLADGAGTVLDLLEKEKIPITSHCRQGYCGACRVKAKGEVEYIHDPLGFCRKDEILACCSKPKSHLEIDVRTVQ